MRAPHVFVVGPRYHSFGSTVVNKCFTSGRVRGIIMQSRQRIMFFQMILKGIPGSDDAEATITLREQGIHCRWWDRVGMITPPQMKERLNERDLDWHLNRYDQPDPTRGGDLFCDHTAFISTTAGVVERDVWQQRNWILPAFMTALRFATRNFTCSGYIYYGYVYTLGKKSVELQEFSEEVRELNVFHAFMPYHDEGEIVAKIFIPAVNLEKCEKYDGSKARVDLGRGRCQNQWTSYAMPHMPRQSALLTFEAS